MTRGQRLVALALLALVVLGVAFGDDVRSPGNELVTPTPLVPAPTTVPSSATTDGTATLLALPVPAGGDVFTGQVVRIADGDTLTVEVVEAGSDVDVAPGDRVRIRLLRIDTPELARDGQAQECWAERATDALAALAPVGAELVLQYDVERVDRFDRTLAHAWTRDGTWVNGALLAGGHARVLTFRPNVAHDERVRELERLAAQDELGLWGACPA